MRSFRNRALNHRRSLWRRLTRELESLRWFEKSPGESEAERAAMDCLAALPVEQREAIVLKIWHRFTFEEIGGLLGLSPNTAAGRYRYGLQKIKRQLKGAVYGRERNEISWRRRLRSWRPRRPSATLKWRLFLARAMSAPRMFRVAGWLMPTTACALLTLLVLNSENAVPAGGQRQPSIMAMLSNQSYAVYATSRQSEQNNLSVFTFDWTNRSGSGFINDFPQFRK